MKYFTIKELCKSNTAEKYGIDNTPNATVIANLEYLVEQILDPLREWYGKPICVNSGYRSIELNRKVGGVSNSQHLTGCAADIDTHNDEENRLIYKYIVDNFDFDQCIWEKGGAWIHVSIKKEGNRRQTLSIN